VLTADSVSNSVHRLTIDGAGVVSGTGDVIGIGSAINAVCAPGAATGLGISFDPGAATSFGVPGLGGLDSRALGSRGQSAVVSPDGTRLYVRTGSAVEGYLYDSTTGAIGPAPFVSIPVAGTAFFFGIDQLALHPDGTKLYVSQTNTDTLDVHDAFTGAPLASMPLPPGTRPNGVCLAPNRAPDCSAAVADRPKLWPPNHKLVEIGIGGVTDPDGDAVTITATSVTQDEAVLAKGGGSGNTSPDARLSPLAVRAERNGNPKSSGNGRVYHVSFTADDGQGGSCDGTVHVCVPHDQRPGATCVDGGPLYNSIP
jgi:hypothetical protein